MYLLKICGVNVARAHPRLLRDAIVTSSGNKIMLTLLLMSFQWELLLISISRIYFDVCCLHNCHFSIHTAKARVQRHLPARRRQKFYLTSTS